MAELIVTSAINKSISESLDLRSCNANTISILLVYITIEYNSSKVAIIEPEKVMSQRPELKAL